MPMKLAAIENRAFGFFFIVNFDQSVHAQPMRGGFELANFPIFENRNDQQNAVGARQTRFGDLDFIENEILAQRRFLRHAARGVKSSSAP